MKLWTIAWFELRMLTRTRAVLLNLFLLPMVLIFILGNALSSNFKDEAEASVEQARVLIVEPNTGGAVQGELEVGLGLREFLNSPEIKQRMRIEKTVSREEAVEALTRGEADFGVIIPSDFEERVTAGKEAQWELIPGKDSMKNYVAQMIFHAYLDEVNRMQAAIIALGPQGIGEAMGTMSGLEATYVETASLNEGGETYSAFQYYAAAMLIMFLLYSGLSASISLSEEKRKKTLYRLNSMPVSTLEIFMGKIAGNSLVAFLQAAVIICGTSWFYGVDWGRHLWMLALTCLLVVIASMMLAVILTLLTKSSAVARSAVVTVIVVMTFLSGGFQPLPMEIIQRMGEFTVNHWAMQAILRLMLGADPGEVMHYLMMLGLFCGLLLAAGIVSYRKVGYHE
ncbi:ABC transporter permease [Paenibacillus woosongensis]|uniref:Transport permease YfiM n=2 Tax=Paenibacillus TaxID=44249 RepID=A0ABQ4MRT9_9BACL|nr:ABC transporter permease [Paenibacillus woosongensis]GIP58629.1 putative transport permease YfiM [Paenibacillus woosongensis]